MYDLIVKIIDVSNDLATMKLIASTFNFYVSNKTRNLLEKCLICSFRQEITDAELRQEITEFRIYVLKLIFNMFRANSIKFHVFFIDILINSLIHDQQSSIKKNETLKNDVDYGDENSEGGVSDLNELYITELSINLIEYFFNIRPDLVDAYFELNIFNKYV